MGYFPLKAVCFVYHLMLLCFKPSPSSGAVTIHTYFSTIESAWYIFWSLMSWLLRTLIEKRISVCLLLLLFYNAVSTVEAMKRPLKCSDDSEWLTVMEAIVDNFNVTSRKPCGWTEEYDETSQPGFKPSPVNCKVLIVTAVQARSAYQLLKDSALWSFTEWEICFNWISYWWSKISEEIRDGQSFLIGDQRGYFCCLRPEEYPMIKCW
jgi:hypothetical protein